MASRRSRRASAGRRSGIRRLSVIFVNASCAFDIVIAVVTELSAGIVRRAALLADGRELFYYDDADTRLWPDRAVDARVLDPRPETATMRQDVLTGEWISIAAARQNRVFLPPANQDPLAPQSAGNPSEIPAVYDVAVFENRSPSFGPGLGRSSTAGDTATIALDPPRGVARSGAATQP